jgi:OOP family OmpA-OmpF porin
MGNGFSPLDAGLDGATADLQSQSGQLAVIAFSDGNDMQQYDPVGAAKRMKKAYGDRVCIYTVVIGDKAALIDLGDKAEGVKMMKKVADAGECGFSVIGESISTPAGMADFVEKVFLEAKRPEPPRPGPPPPAPVQEMKKAPLQSKTMVFEAAALFDFDKSDLKPEGKEQIKAYRDKAREEMSRADKVKITGHTDNIGKPEYNMKLSLRRAETVRDYLISFGGIDPKKLEVIGKGENNPIAENSTEKGRAKNRRVEIEVIGLEK